MWTVRTGISARYLRLGHRRGATSIKSGQERRRVRSISRGACRSIACRWFDEGLRYSLVAARGRLAKGLELVEVAHQCVAADVRRGALRGLGDLIRREAHEPREEDLILRIRWRPGLAKAGLVHP
jgi:hypothetical protein